ncbi:hypothetical protein [Myceligenerans crystallogenes]|uniref:DUF423 domain-containing protein n=1 Tax=Myceligenerans crystallogenes TaxID=316335 RepID=A0ABP4ZXH9_9MICO
MLELSDGARITAAIVLLTLVGIESGGFFLLRIHAGKVPATDFQKAFYRAGHAHAGVLVILGLLCTLLAEATGLRGFWHWLAATGVLIAAILLPGGFFLSAMGEGRTTPNGLKVLFPAGAAFLGAGVVTLAIGLLTS